MSCMTQHFLQQRDKPHMLMNQLIAAPSASVKWQIFNLCSTRKRIYLQNAQKIQANIQCNVFYFIIFGFIYHFKHLKHRYSP